MFNCIEDVVEVDGPDVDEGHRFLISVYTQNFGAFH